MTEPIVSVSGVRGVVGESLLPDTYLKYILAFGTMLKGGKVIVGGDTRISREMMRHLTFAGLISCGCEIIDIGIVPTPTVPIMVTELNADGGIAITASHNPREWNAYKFYSSAGTCLSKPELGHLLRIHSSGNFRRAKIDEIGHVKTYDNAIGIHIEKVLNFIDVASIKEKKIKVVVDCCNGAGYQIIPELLGCLSCEAIVLHADKNKDFPHPPEPLPQNLTELAQSVAQNKADVGFAVDPDSDRLVIVDENGKHIGEERTVTLVCDYLSPRLKSPIVVNLCTTMAIDDVAKKHNVPIVRSPVGEANVVAKMQEVGSKVGGEGNGGIIIPEIHSGRDAIIGIGVMLELLACCGTTISKYNKTIPRYVMGKEKCPRDASRIDYDVIEQKLTDKFGAPDTVVTDDGLKLVYSDSWVHVRPSGTEPIIRIIVEADSESKLEKMMEFTKTVLQ